MKVLTLKDIRDVKPCYDPAKYLPEEWQGTVLDLLDTESCSAEDRIWVVAQLVSDRVARLFACACSERSLSHQTLPVDPRSLEAVKVARAFAMGEATREELERAESAAWAATTSAAERSAAESAARSAAWAATTSAESAAWAATTSAAESAEKRQQIEIFKQIIKEYEV